MIFETEKEAIEWMAGAGIHILVSSELVNEEYRHLWKLIIPKIEYESQPEVTFLQIINIFAERLIPEKLKP